MFLVNKGLLLLLLFMLYLTC